MKKDLLHTPEGVRDIYNGECARKIVLQNRLHDVCALYGYNDIQTPSFEFFDVFNKERGSVPSTEMFKFFDRYGNTLVLRPDMTPAIARTAAKYFEDDNRPLKLCYVGNTFVNVSKYYQGKLKESTAVGAELIGDDSIDADLEIISMVIDCMKNAGLEEVRFKALFPGRQYHFVQVEEGFREPSYFLERLKDFKKAQKPVQLIIFRRLADGSQIFCSNVEMGLEEYTIVEQGGEQGDFWVEISLKEYRKMQSIAYRPASGGNTLEKQPAQRSAKETAKTYVVKKGDNLWNIAKKELGDGSKFGELAKKNGISNPSLIYPGQVIKL